jgi:hypothetical protein
LQEVWASWRRAETDKTFFVTGRPVIGYDHGYDAEVFLPRAGSRCQLRGGVRGWCLERIGEDNPEEEWLFRDLWEDETQGEEVVESLKADCEVRTGRPTVVPVR